MSELSQLYLIKAEESLLGAESEFTHGRYNNVAHRCYYACFQAAVAALHQAGVYPRGSRSDWGHAFVQAEFVGRLINRRSSIQPNSARCWPDISRFGILQTTRLSWLPSPRLPVHCNGLVTSSPQFGRR